MEYIEDRGREFLTVPEAAELTGHARLTVDRAIADGTLQYVAVAPVGRHIVKVLKKHDVLAWFIDPRRERRSDFVARRDARLAELIEADHLFAAELADARSAHLIPA
ncbi:hypothetical protein AFL01nite_05160 [Aeromicrobium flavum]|uniref:Helix-turn-helix domain-containing protein n=1 Tax=Aeromicrobium flavum TaxID=416568 RepID=A0A512HRV5_9ACTN|nr:hypothetical protein [Aeromicrobium flavum]GEO88189.1 hypothetical protein AFL01nite_05160 [Aeromicrobium flavum]